VTLTQQTVTPDAVMGLRSGRRGSSSGLTASGKQLAIPRIPKFDRISKSSRVRNMDCMVLSGKAVLVDEILPSGIAGSTPERPPSRYMLDISSITAAAEASLLEFSSSARENDSSSTSPPPAAKQRPPSSGGYSSYSSSSSVKVGEYSPRVLRDMGLPMPPSKSDRDTPTKQSSVASGGSSVIGRGGVSLPIDDKRRVQHDPRRASRIPRSSRAS
jgi:hypothetical protein